MATDPSPAFGPGAIRKHALAQDTATLDPEHPVNRRQRDAGSSIPEVVRADPAASTVTIRASFIRAHIDLPMGWFADETWQRLRVVDPEGETELEFNLLRHTGILAAIQQLEKSERKEQSAAEFAQQDSDGLLSLLVRYPVAGGQRLEHVHLVSEGPDTTKVLHVRVTATQRQREAAYNLGSAMMRSVVFELPEPIDANPVWLQEARAFELADRLKEAEDAIRAGVPHQGALISIAHLYRERMLRLRALGDEAGAAAACAQAQSWAYGYAGSATSGGEGAALSLQRDEFLALLNG